jgi:hypothetical protein
VFVDGNAVAAITAAGTAYATYTTTDFTVAAGLHTIVFQGSTSTGNNTAFVDKVNLHNAVPPLHTSIVGLPPSGTVTAGTAVTLTAQATGGLGQDTFRWAVIQSGKLVANGTGVSLTFTPVTAGNYQIALRATDSIGDVASTSAVLGVTLAPNTLLDGGFESPKVGTGAWGDYQYNPTGTAWTFTGQTGVAGNGSAFTAGNPNAPEGNQVAFLQMNGSFSQPVNFTAGTYNISFEAAQRQNDGSSQTFQVLVDNNVVGTVTPAGAAYADYATSNFTVTVGLHTIKFLGLNPRNGNNTALID